MTRFEYGEQSRAFRLQEFRSDRDPPHLCFSLYTVARSLDLVADNERELERSAEQRSAARCQPFAWLQVGAWSEQPGALHPWPRLLHAKVSRLLTWVELGAFAGPRLARNLPAFAWPSYTRRRPRFLTAPPCFAQGVPDEEVFVES